MNDNYFVAKKTKLNRRIYFIGQNLVWIKFSSLGYVYLGIDFNLNFALRTDRVISKD